MKLSKQWTTVTPLSKMIALILFVALPFIGFQLGMQYQRGLQDLQSVEKSALDGPSSIEWKQSSYPSVLKIENTIPVAPERTQTPVTTSKYSCAIEKTCDHMSSCEEAYYQMNVCGYYKRDGDNDGVPCEKICPGG